MFRAVTMFICISMLLSSCASLKGNSKEEKEQAKTAKINAQLGIAYLERNNVNRAKKKLILAMEQGPTIPETWYSMAYFLEATGNKEEARKYYLKAISLGPQRGDVQNNYGTFLCRSGAYEESIKHFMLAAKDPDYLDTADAYENAGLCAMKIPNKELAYHYFNSAISHNPSRPISLIKVAQIEYENGDYKEAKIKLDQYLAIAPITPQISGLVAKINSKGSSRSAAHASAHDDDAVDEEPYIDNKPKRVTYRTFLRGSQPKHVYAATHSKRKESARTHRHLMKSERHSHKVKHIMANKMMAERAHTTTKMIKQNLKHKHTPTQTVVFTENQKVTKRKARPVHSEAVYSWRV